MQIDLTEGYDTVDTTQEISPEQMPMEMIDQDTGEVTKV